MLNRVALTTAIYVIFSLKSGGSNYIAAKGSLDEFQKDKTGMIETVQFWLPRTGIAICSTFVRFVSVQNEPLDVVMIVSQSALQAVMKYGAEVLLPFKNDTSILVGSGDFESSHYKRS